MDRTAGGGEASYARTSDEVLVEIASRVEGLTEDEARERLVRFGPNLLAAPKQASAWKILIDQLRSVVVLLLVVAAGVAFLAGDPVDAAAIGAVLLINVSLGFVTELRARRAMDALLRLDAPSAIIVREGRPREVPASEIVPGDIVQLEAGAAIPADARLLAATELRVNEASLTGESLPVSKQPAPVAPDTPLPDRFDMLYKGTTVAAGTGRAVVVATGMATELGRIGGLVAAIPDERTPLEHRLDALGRRLVGLALAIGGAMAVAGILRGDETSLVIETAVALAIAAVPEGLPAVATIALAVGVRRMARRNALVRRLPAVETLGSVTVVCTDKTGTLTAGETTVSELWVAGRNVTVSGAGYTPAGEFREEGRAIDPSSDAQLSLALTIGVLANRAELEEEAGAWVGRGDPTEVALLVAARKGGVSREALGAVYPEVGELPFSSERMLMATYHAEANGPLLAFVKGAPGRILERCDSVLTPAGDRVMDPTDRERITERNSEMAMQGLRVLALARGHVASAGEASLHGLTFVGLVGMIDPAAEGVKETIRTLRDAGIRTIMLTGDQKLTAHAVAEDLGIIRFGERTLDGRDLVGITDTELAAQVVDVAAFSRVSPEDKLKIVSALREEGEIVGMLGDGVNDAAALRRADVGVAMGIRGTDVAKEVAVVVLQDDRFQTVAAAVEEGRVVFDNIRKFVFYLFSCNLAEIFVLLGATLIGLPLPLLPLQILWLNLVTDTFPALALALEPAEPDVMRRPPRDPQQAIMSARFIRAISFYAGLITISSLGALWYGLSYSSGSAVRAQTLCFATIALAQAFHLGNARSQGPVVSPRRATANRYALGAVLLVATLQLLAVEWTPLGSLLGTEKLALSDWAVVLALASFPALVGQALKLVRGNRDSTPAHGD